MWRDSSEKTKKKEKISSLCFESCCDVFGIEGEKGAPMRTRPYSCSWINYWFGLLLLLDYYVFVLMKIGSWEVWKNTRKNGHFSLFGPRVWTLFRSKIFFVMKIKMKKIIQIRNWPCFATRWVQSKNPIVSWIKIEKTDFFHVFPLFWLRSLYISKAIAPSSSFSFETFTHYQIGALQRQWALGRAR